MLVGYNGTVNLEEFFNVINDNAEHDEVITIKVAEAGTVIGGSAGGSFFLKKQSMFSRKASSHPIMVMDNGGGSPYLVEEILRMLEEAMDEYGDWDAELIVVLDGTSYKAYSDVSFSPHKKQQNTFVLRAAFEEEEPEYDERHRFDSFLVLG